MQNPSTGTAIVVEGGAMRGIFAAGVLDLLLERRLNTFDLAIGTSAGAANLASFVAGQQGRNLHCYTEIMTRPELFSWRRFARGGHYMDLDWLWDCFAREYPLDQTAIQRNATELVSVATCYHTGSALYHTQREDIHEGVKGGCALPLLYRGPVMYRGVAMVDGGVSDAIPAAEAHRRGHKRLVVVRSRPTSTFKKRGSAEVFGALMMRNQKQLARAILVGSERYASTVAFLNVPPSGVQVVQIAPDAPLATTRTTQNRATLLSDYQLGRQVASRLLPQIEELLGNRPRISPLSPASSTR